MFRIIFYSLFVLAALTLTASSATAQEIRGDVRFQDSGQPVIGALVRCSGTGGISEQLTDRSGKFYFRVSPGNYDVTVHAPGYIEGAQSVTLTDFNASEYMAIRLKPDRSSTKTALRPSVVEANVPPDAQKAFDKAEAAMATGKKEAIPEAIRHYQRSITIYPKFLQAQLKLGTAYMDLGEWDKAEQELKKTLVIDPNAANAMFALGEIYLRQRKDEEAEKILLQGLKVEDRSYQGHLTLGRVYWDMGSKLKEEAQWRPLLDKSYEQAKRALELNPNFAAAHLLKGNLLLRVRRAPDALREFEEYLRLEPAGPLADQTRVAVEKIKKALAEQKP